MASNLAIRCLRASQVSKVIIGALVLVLALYFGPHNQILAAEGEVNSDRNSSEGAISTQQVSIILLNCLDELKENDQDRCKAIRRMAENISRNHRYLKIYRAPSRGDFRNELTIVFAKAENFEDIKSRSAVRSNIDHFKIDQGCNYFDTAVSGGRIDAVYIEDNVGNIEKCFLVSLYFYLDASPKEYISRMNAIDLKNTLKSNF